MNIEETFGLILKKLRQEKGFSQEGLASISGFHRTYISLLERGIKNPSLTTMLRLSQALDISLTRFIENIEKSYKS